MPQTRKIATCCYCGTRAVLVFDRERHELACAACGAPLHELKMMPCAKQTSTPQTSTAPRSPAPAHFRPASGYRELPKRARKKTKRKRKPFSRKLFEELWDVVEDIFD